MEWHSAYLEEIYRSLVSGERGLSREEAARRLKELGKNIFREYKEVGAVQIFFSQFGNIFILLLIAAGVISIISGDRSDGAIIFLVVFINSTVGFFQEYRAERTFRTLQRTLVEVAVVFRSGEEVQVPREEIVPGDVVLVERGGRIPADIRIIEGRHILANESALTGEWLPVKKEPGVFSSESALADRTNMLYMGTFLEDGTVRGIAVATGPATEFGKIGESVADKEFGRTPLEKRLNRFSVFFGLAVLAVVSVIFGAGIGAGIPLVQMFLSSVALAVAAVPEGLAISLTIVLAIGMKRILRRKGLVRRLFAAETLGSVSLIATDKTGTLTEGRMQVSHILTGARELLRDGEKIAGLQNAGEGGEESHLLALKIAAASAEAVIENPDAELEPYRIRGRPTDRALAEAALEAGIRKIDMERKGEVLDTLPFNETRKYSAVIFRGKDSDTHMLGVVGAPEVILGFSKTIHMDGKVAALESREFQSVRAEYERLVGLGLRVVAVGHRVVERAVFDDAKFSDRELCMGLSFVGFIALRDPVRKDVASSLREVLRAGVRMVIITGDHPKTAVTVAQELGIPISPDHIFLGKDIEPLSREALIEKASSIVLWARVSPLHKVRIVEAYQARGESVAMVGDGMNDAPALRAADIGVALGSGTDVAKEASGLVLLDNSFSTIVAAIREGRIILENIRKTITFLLSDGFTEITMVALSLFFGLPLPLLPGQILWINLIEDSFPALALAFEKGERGIMERRPEKKIRLLEGPLMFLIAAFGIVVSFSAFFLFQWLYHTTDSLSYARTMAFAAISVDSLFYIVSIKHLRSGFSGFRLWDNPMLILAIVVGLLLAGVAVYVPFFQNLLQTVPLSVRDWGLIIGFGAGTLVMIELLKLLALRVTPRLFFNH